MSAPAFVFRSFGLSNAYEWGVEDVVRWFTCQPLNPTTIDWSVQMVLNQSIDGRCLLSLEKPEIKILCGEMKLGPRHRIAKAIAKLKKRVDEQYPAGASPNSPERIESILRGYICHFTDGSCRVPGDRHTVVPGWMVNTRASSASRPS